MLLVHFTPENHNKICEESRTKLLKRNVCIIAISDTSQHLIKTIKYSLLYEDENG